MARNRFVGTLRKILEDDKVPECRWWEDGMRFTIVFNDAFCAALSKNNYKGSPSSFTKNLHAYSFSYRSESDKRIVVMHSTCTSEKPLFLRDFPERDCKVERKNCRRLSGEKFMMAQKKMHKVSGLKTEITGARSRAGKVFVDPVQECPEKLFVVNEKVKTYTFKPLGYLRAAKPVAVNCVSREVLLKQIAEMKAIAGI